MRILLIEDDFQLNQTIKRFLEIKGHDVIASYDGDNALTLIDEDGYDLYVIDIKLPKINGLDIIKYIRQKDRETPIVIITASIDFDTFLEAYDSGCDEYIKKPFHLQELEIRINKLLSKNTKDTIQVDDRIFYNFDFNELYIDGQEVKLRKKESRFLRILLKNLNHVVKNEDIINYVWENEIKDTYPLRQLISELRNKIQLEKNHIISEVGVGYKFEV